MRHVPESFPGCAVRNRTGLPDGRAPYGYAREHTAGTVRLRSFGGGVGLRFGFWAVQEGNDVLSLCRLRIWNRKKSWYPENFSDIFLKNMWTVRNFKKIL